MEVSFYDPSGKFDNFGNMWYHIAKKEYSMYETAIIGSGIAGVSAALTLYANKKDFIWFGSRRLSGKISKAECIRNYPGLPSVSGEDFVAAMLRQIDALGIAITEKTVTGVYAMGEYYTILCNNETYEAKTVILATGVETTRTIAGESEFVGRGVSYCATCDGFLYKGKTIAVLCTSKELEHEIEYLASLAQKVYLFPLYKGVDLQASHIERINVMPEKIEGNRRVETLTVGGQALKIDGMFFLKQSVSPGVLVGGIQMDGAHVSVARDMSTNLPGLFACGDCTGRPYQYAKAAGEGNVAAHSVIAYLHQTK